MSKVHVIFDLDDTLYPEHDHAYSGFRAVERYAQGAWGVSGLGAEMTRLLDRGHLGAAFKLALEARLPQHTDAHLADVMRVYREHEPEITLYEDGQWALEHYGRQGPLGLITDGNAAVQQKKIDALAIAHHFEAMVLTGALGQPREFHKPHPLAYELIEQRIGAPGDAYVYIGDNPAKDFVTPNARGWRTVQVLRPRSIHDQSAVASGGAPQHQVRSLRELPEILAF